MSTSFLRSAVVAATVTVTSVFAVATPSFVDALDNTPWRTPTTPPSCTVSQANSGDVGSCLMRFYGDPADTGWGSPPAPGVGTGWVWNGSTYRGSPALAGWESTFIRSNSSSIGNLGVGQIETHVAAKALFEGFLRDITGSGYVVRHASGYSFRCMSGNGGWSCPSGDPGDLSNHAWGLAVDMNSGTNPIRTYSGVNGQTACQTPMETDMPRWVIQTAERWGLYWGGYGWNSGCQSPTTQRTSVYRDPPHFEFRGTPDQARAIAAFNLRNDPRVTCTTTVDASGRDVEQCTRTGRPETGWRVAIDAGAPAGTSAVMINLAAFGSDQPGYLMVDDCSPTTGLASRTAAVTFAAGQIASSLAIAPLDERGRFCVLRSAASHTAADVLGYLGSGSDAQWYQPTTPTRLTDTRKAGGKVPAKNLRTVANDATARIANVTVVEASGPGYLKAGRCDVLASTTFVNVSYDGPAAKGNLAIVDGGGTGSCVYAVTNSHVVVDQLGTLTSGEGLGWRLTSPERLLDTRKCTPQWCNGKPGAGVIIRLPVDTEAQAIAAALSVTETAGPGFLTVGRCADLAPKTSNLNHGTASTVTNLAIVDVGDGEMCIYTMASAHVIVDLQAELVHERVTGLTPVDPVRVHDSRKG